MPEFPEIAILASQMNEALRGKTIAGMEVLQPKCLNVPPDQFAKRLVGARIAEVTNRGKWLFWRTTQGWLLLNLGMGGETILTTRDRLPEKRRLILDFADGSCLSVNFWWFGYAHYVPEGELESHAMTRRLGPNALPVDAGKLAEALSHQRGQIKAWLLNQDNLAGIGNSYVHDILFLAGVHPLRRIPDLSEQEIARLADAIRQVLESSLAKRGASYEQDLYGEKGGFGMEEILVGYREGQPCPRCGTPIEKLKTGSTTSFICPQCQRA